MRNSPVSGRMFVGVLVVALIVPLGVPLEGRLAPAPRANEGGP